MNLIFNGKVKHQIRHGPLISLKYCTLYWIVAVAVLILVGLVIHFLCYWFVVVVSNAGTIFEIFLKEFSLRNIWENFMNLRNLNFFLRKRLFSPCFNGCFSLLLKWRNTVNCLVLTKNVFQNVFSEIAFNIHTALNTNLSSLRFSPQDWPNENAPLRKPENPKHLTNLARSHRPTAITNVVVFALTERKM